MKPENQMMTTPPVTFDRVALSPRALILPLALVVLGAAVAAYGLAVEPARVWPNLLHDGIYVLSAAVAGAFFFAGTRLSAARWSVGLRRVPEALMLIVPIAGLLVLALYFGRHSLYEWTHDGFFANDPPIAGRGKYLTVPGVFGRAVVTVALWTVFAFVLRRISLAQDKDPAGSLRHHGRMNTVSAAFAVVFVPTFTFIAYDFIISLEPHWFSTMFAVYVFAGAWVQGISVVTLAVVVLRQRGLLRNAAGDAQLHDLGKLMFAFTVFWAYIWVSQYLLIWYGNIPEETPYFIKRTSGGWLPLFVLNFLVNWVVPFIVLMSVKAKKDPRVMGFMAVWLLLGHWLDLYVMIRPAHGQAPAFGLYEVAIAAGYIALAFLLFVRNLGRAPVIPLADPVMADDAAQEAALELHT